MKKLWRRRILAGLFLMSFVFPATAPAILIQYEATELSDTTEGADLWQYTYAVSDHTFNAGQGFTIYFDHLLYKEIESPTPTVNGEWDIIVWQPEPSVSTDGAYDALSVTSKAEGASLEQPFTVQFVWLGDGTPGSQSFEIYQERPFNVLTSGTTTSLSAFDLVIPEGIGLIHIPLQVLEVNGAEATINTVGELYDALGGAENVNFIITYQPPTPSTPGRWQSYLGEQSRGTSAERTIRDDLGIITVMKNRVRLRLRGLALGTDGASTVTLNRGTNLVGVPLKDERLLRVSDLLRLEGIAGKVAAVIVLDPNDGAFKVVARAGDEGDIQIAGGSAFILTTPEAGSAQVRGAAWENVSGNVAAAPMMRAGYTLHSHPPLLESPLVDSQLTLDRLWRHILSTANLTGNPIHFPNRIVFEKPTETLLLSNYPNPFNPETWIPFRLAKAATVRLRIYDDRGRLVRDLELGYKPAGVYASKASAAYWDGRNASGEQVASGIYFYQMTAGDFTAVRRMFVVK
jgi:hypothetical protein